MAWAWTGVGSLKPFFSRLLFSRADRGNSEKLFIFEFFGEENRRADYLTKGEGVADQLPVDSIIARN
jgi:hypothetical protein